MPRRTVRCPSGHHVQVEIQDGYATGKAMPQNENTRGLPGHNQVCPICNRLLFIEYIKQ
jgi:hypothetical protein